MPLGAEAPGAREDRVGWLMALGEMADELEVQACL
jgi:hypothetical protein